MHTNAENPLIAQPLCKFGRQPRSASLALHIILHRLRLDHGYTLCIESHGSCWRAELHKGNNPHNPHFTELEWRERGGGTQEDRLEEDGEEIWPEAVCSYFKVVTLPLSHRLVRVASTRLSFASIYLDDAHLFVLASRRRRHNASIMKQDIEPALLA